MGDQFVSKLLKDWGFSNLINVFENEGIDKEAFDSLRPNCPMSQKLLEHETFGVQIKFGKRLENYILGIADREALKLISIEDPDLLDLVHKQSTETGSVDDSQLEAVGGNRGKRVGKVNAGPVMKDKNENEIQNKKQTQSNEEMSGRYSSQQLFSDLGNLDITAILNESFDGRLLLISYEKNGHLTVLEQQQLTDILISFLLLFSDPTGRPFTLKNNHFASLVKEIINRFPNENPKIYYVAPKTEGPKQKIAKGKLVDCYRNKIKKLKIAGVIPKKRKRTFSEMSSDLEDSSENFMQNITFLRNNTTPWADVEDNWDKCFPLREETRNSRVELKIDAFFKKWPIVTLPNGYTLIERDFEQIFGNKLIFYENWPNFLRKIEKLMGTEIKDLTSKKVFKCLSEPSVEKSVKELTILTLLPALLPPENRIKLQNKCIWKPSIPESLDGFILHVKSPMDLENCRTQRENLIYSKKLPVQPYVIVVGPKLSSIQSSYVSVDKVLYKLESPLKAVDICYKIYQVLDAQYPPESEQIWLLLQRSLYECRNEEDKNIKCVLRVEKLLDEIE